MTRKVISVDSHDVKIERTDTTHVLSFTSEEILDHLINQFCLDNKVSRRQINRDLCGISITKHNSKATIVVMGSSSGKD